MRGKWKGHKDLEQFTQGQITENKGELIKSLIQLKGFQRAFGDRWNGRLEAQTSQEGPTHQCLITAFLSHFSTGAFLPPREQNSPWVIGYTAPQNVYSVQVSKIYILKLQISHSKSNKQNTLNKSKTLQRMGKTPLFNSMLFGCPLWPAEPASALLFQPRALDSQRDGALVRTASTKGTFCLGGFRGWLSKDLPSSQNS